MNDALTETIYKGQPFRSKLAAYWAVFFDTLRIGYTYQTKSVHLNDVSYQPDFWIPHSMSDLAADGWGFWGVCSPSMMHVEPLNTVVALVEKTRHNALVFEGYPWEKAYSVVKISGVHQTIPVVDIGFLFKQDQKRGLIGLKGPSGSSYPTVPIPGLNYAYHLARQTRFD